MPTSRIRRALPPAILVLTLILAGVSRARPMTAQQLPSGVQLCEEAGFSGRCQIFTDNNSDLRGSYIGNDMAAAIRVAPGWTAAVYEHINFGGRCETFTADRADLRGSYIGDHEISSIRVRRTCSDPLDEPRPFIAPPSALAEGVRLCQDLDYEGVCETFTLDSRDLRNSNINAREASSIRVAPGWIAALYEFPNFEGRCETFTVSNPDLRVSTIGNDAAASLRVGSVCPGSDGVAPLYVQRDLGNISLDETSCKALDPANAEYLYAFDGAAGQRVAVRMDAYGDSALDGYLYLFAPTDAGAAAGTVIAEDDNAGGGGNALLRIELPGSGRYRIVAASKDRASTGAYCLSVRRDD